MAATETGLLAERLRAAGDIKLAPFLMAGYPDRERSIALGRMYAELGAAAIEVSIPFSDPLADGPVVQRAAQEALEGGMTPGRAIEVAGEIAVSGTPVVLMTYINPVLSYGVEKFAFDASDAGVAGVIVPDLPLEEAQAVIPTFRAAGIDTVFLVAPTSPDHRIAAACAESRGFVYCVTLTGVTGVRPDLEPGLKAFLSRVRGHTSLPLAAGFGISSPAHIEQLRGHADAAIVASALLAEIQAGREPRHLLEALVGACR